MVITRNPRTFLIDTGVFKLPLADGTNGQAMVTDGEQNLSFTSTLLGFSLSDVDGDTLIQVEESTDDDVVRIDVGDTPAGYGAVADIFTIASSGWTVAMGTANTATTSGAPISLTAGTGNTTGAGGAVNIDGGTGGGTNGFGGDITLTGGVNTGAGSAGGVILQGRDAVGTGIGGEITIAAGDALVGGAGGIVNITSGSNGSSGGNLQLTAGSGTTSGGGNIALKAGFSTTSTGGQVTIASGSGNGGAVSGNVTISVGRVTGAGDAGDVIINGFNASLGVGSAIDLNAGNSGGANVGGTVTIDAGKGGATGIGGAASLTAGAGGITSGAGGDATLKGGDADGGGLGGAANVTAGAGASAGGPVTLTAGNAGTLGIGGAVDINAGVGAGAAPGGAVTIDGGTGGTSAGGDGGAITLTGGNAGAASAGAGGNIVLLAGTEDGAGAPGVIEIQSDLEALNAAGPAVRNVAASSTVATLIPDRAVNSGIGTSGDSLDFVVDGVSRLRVGTGVGNPNTVLQPSGTSGLFLGSVSGSFGLHNLAASATVPTLLPSFLTETAGIGANAAGEVSLINASTESMRLTSSLITHFRDIEATIAGGPAIRNEAASNTNPVFNPNKANAGTGLGTDSSGNFSAMIHNGAEAFRFNTSGNLSLANVNTVSGASLVNEVPSSTNPTLIPAGADLDTGIGTNALDELSIIAGGVEMMRFDEDVTDTITFTAASFEASNASGPALLDETVSTTNPTLIPFKTDLTSGIGSPFSGGLSFITSGVERVRVDTVRTTFFQNTEMISANSASLINATASATVPTIVPDDGTPTAGIGRNTAGSVSIITAGVERLRVDVTGNVIQLGPRQEGSVAGSYAILNELASGTNPTLCPNKADQDTGIGQDVAGRVSIIGNGAENMRVQSGAAGDTRFLIFDEDNGTLERVTVGIADSGGTGFKVLRIPN